MHFQTSWAALPLLAAVQASPILTAKSVAPSDQTIHQSRSNTSSLHLRAEELLFDHAGMLMEFENCDDREKGIIHEAWTGAGKLANTITNEGAFPRDYGLIMSSWLGKDWDGLVYGPKVRGVIERAALYFNNQLPNDEKITFVCPMSTKKCEAEQAKAYHYRDNTFLDGKMHNVITLCPIFMTGLTDLKSNIDKYNTPADLEYIVNYDDARAKTLYHEVTHFKSVGVVNNQREDRVIDVGGGRGWNAWCLAKDKGTVKSYINADSYAEAALAMYVQVTSGSPYPPAFVAPQGSTIDRECAELWQDLEGHNELRDAEPEDDPTDEDKQNRGANKPPQGLHCNGVEGTKWVTFNALNKVLDAFCTEADRPDVQSTIFRDYAFGDDHFTLGIEWPAGAPWKPTKNVCMTFMTNIMNGCDGLAASNPLNHKRGGYEQFGVAKFSISPTKERYNTGVCSFRLVEVERITGSNGLGTAEKHTFTVDMNMIDGANRVMTQSTSKQAAGDGAPFIYRGLYELLEVTPEANGGGYVHYTIGEQSWTSMQSSGDRRCNLGAWSPSDVSDETSGFFINNGRKQQRDMDCFFLC